MKPIPIKDMSPERLRVELQSSLNLNKLLDERLKELEAQLTVTENQRESWKSSSTRWCERVDELEAQLAEYQWGEDNIVKDLHNVMSLVAKDKYFWNELGYYGGGFTAEEIIGFMLKALAENGSKIACSGKIEDMRPIPPLSKKVEASE